MRIPQVRPGFRAVTGELLASRLAVRAARHCFCWKGRSKTTTVVIQARGQRAGAGRQQQTGEVRSQKE